MDVTCERCQAEYEFDDALLGENGTTVKCSACAHVFRVLPPAASARPGLKIRLRRSGSVAAMPSLRELQRRIYLGEVTADDELGRDGFEWRRLGDVPELRGFFATTRNSVRPPSLSVSEQSMPPNRPPLDAVKHTIQGVGPAQPVRPSPPRAPAVQALPPAQAIPPAQGAPAASAKPTAAAASRSSPPFVAKPAAPPFVAKPAAPPAPAKQTVSQPTPSKPVRGLYLAENEAAPARASAAGAKTGAWLAGGVILLLGGWFAVTAIAGRHKADEAVIAPRTEVPPPAAAATPEAPATAAPEPLEAPAAAPAPKAEPATPKAEAPAAAAPTASSTPQPAPAAEPEAAEPKEAGKADPKPATAEAHHGAKKEPQDYGAWVVQGDEQLWRGELVEAQRSYERALTLRASGSEANAGLGATLLRAGKVQEAIAPLERAARNGYAEANISLGDAYDKLGQKEQAVSSYRAYLVRLPKGGRAPYARRRIEALEGTPAAPPAPEPGPVEPAPNEESPGPAPSDYRPAGELLEEQPAPETP